MIRILVFCAVGSLFVFGCSEKPAQLEGFDKDLWISDNYGCNGERASLISTITEQKDKILSLNQNQIKQVLGTPDEHELYERTRKFFHYYLEPSSACDSTLTNDPKILQIRFNALGLCNEVFIKNE